MKIVPKMILQSRQDAPEHDTDLDALVVPGAARHDAPATRGTPAAGAPLDARTERLFASLPEHCRLPATRSRFPHVLNRIATEWALPERFLKLIDDLLIDQRGNRQGFPFETVIELTNLRGYYVIQVAPFHGSKLPTRRDPAAWR